MENEIKELIALQAKQIAVEFTIVDFTRRTLEAIDEGKFICKEAEIEFLLDLENQYNKLIISMAEDRVFTLFNKYAEEIIKEREDNFEEVELEELEEIEDYEIEPLEKEDGETDLEYTIKNDIYIKNVHIYNQGKYPESETENYWMIGIDINTLDEQELQELSIFDRDFW